MNELERGQTLAAQFTAQIHDITSIPRHMLDARFEEYLKKHTTNTSVAQAAWDALDAGVANANAKKGK